MHDFNANTFLGVKGEKWSQLFKENYNNGLGICQSTRNRKKICCGSRIPQEGLTSGKGSSLRAKLRGKKGNVWGIQSLWGWHILSTGFHELQLWEQREGSQQCCNLSSAAALGAWNARNAQAMPQSSDSLELMKQMQTRAPSNKEHFQEAGGGSEPGETGEC